jgi:hypothetical protein
MRRRSGCVWSAIPSVRDVTQSACMAKRASVTVRIPEQLKCRLENRALRERRSLSAQER